MTIIFKWNLVILFFFFNETQDIENFCCSCFSWLPVTLYQQGREEELLSSYFQIQTKVQIYHSLFISIKCTWRREGVTPYYCWIGMVIFTSYMISTDTIVRSGLYNGRWYGGSPDSLIDLRPDTTSVGGVLCYWWVGVKAQGSHIISTDNMEQWGKVWAYYQSSEMEIPDTYLAIPTLVKMLKYPITAPLNKKSSRNLGSHSAFSH